MKRDTRKKQWILLGLILLLSSSFLYAFWKQEAPVEQSGAQIAGIDFSAVELQKQIEEKQAPVEEEAKTPQTPDDKSQTPSSNNDTNQTAKPAQPKEEAPVKQPQQQLVTISIDMTNILSHMDKVNDSVKRFIPPNGIVLGAVTMEYQAGDTVYSILQRACSANGISLLANNGYVRYIHDIGEFDAGGSSGWLFQVNGSTPSIGSNSYQVKPNDVIAWRFSVVQGDI